MEQRLSLRNIADIARRANHRMYQAGVRIDSNIRLHAEVPLIALLALVHFRIPLAGFVSGRGWGRNQRRIDYRPFSQKKASLRQMAVDGVEDRFSEVVAFQQVTEVQERRGVRCRLSPQINANEAANSLAVVKGVLNPFVREPKALLGYVHATTILASCLQPKRQDVNTIIHL